MLPLPGKVSGSPGDAVLPFPGRAGRSPSGAALFLPGRAGGSPGGTALPLPRRAAAGARGQHQTEGAVVVEGPCVQSRRNVNFVLFCSAPLSPVP